MKLPTWHLWFTKSRMKGELCSRRLSWIFSLMSKRLSERSECWSMWMREIGVCMWCLEKFLLMYCSRKYSAWWWLSMTKISGWCCDLAIWTKYWRPQHWWSVPVWSISSKTIWLPFWISLRLPFLREGIVIWAFHNIFFLFSKENALLDISSVIMCRDW